MADLEKHAASSNVVQVYNLTRKPTNGNLINDMGIILYFVKVDVESNLFQLSGMLDT
jgi:hypothetical protein